MSGEMLLSAEYAGDSILGSLTHSGQCPTFTVVARVIGGKARFVWWGEWNVFEIRWSGDKIGPKHTLLSNFVNFSAVFMIKVVVIIHYDLRDMNVDGVSAADRVELFNLTAGVNKCIVKAGPSTSSLQLWSYQIEYAATHGCPTSNV